jgi:hypothetical protein
MVVTLLGKNGLVNPEAFPHEKLRLVLARFLTIQESSWSIEAGQIPISWRAFCVEGSGALHLLQGTQKRLKNKRMV